MVGRAYLLGAASVAIWTIGGTRLGDPMSLALNAVGFFACGMVWNAARVFHGRKPILPGLVLGAIAWIAPYDAAAAGFRDAPDHRRGDRRDLCGADRLRIVDRAAPRCRSAGRRSWSR